MSTILKALRRVEREREQAVRRPLREELAAPAGGPVRRVLAPGRAIVAAGAAAAVAGILAGAWSLGRSPAEPPAAPPRSAARGVESRPPAPPPRAPEPEVARVSREFGTALPGAEAAPVAGARPRDERHAQAPAAPPAVVTEPVAPAPPAPIVAKLPAVEPRSEPVAPKAVERAAPPAPEPARAVVRAPLPAVSVKRTIWHPDAGRRVAVVEIPGLDAPVRLSEGDAVGTLVVVRIEPDGVLFQHGNVQLHRAVGEAD